MPSIVNGDSSNFPTSITIPSDGDGPGIKAADVNPAFEALLDMSAYLYKRGGRIIAAIGSLPGAAAADGDVVFVPFVGYYYFSLGLPSGDEDGLLAIRNTADTGTWYWEAYSLLAGETGSSFTADDGIAVVQGGKLGTRIIPNSLVGLVSSEASITFNTTSNSFVDAHAESPISVQTGDRMLIHVQGHLLAESGYQAAAQVLVSDPDGNSYAKEATLRRTSVFGTSANDFIPYLSLIHISEPHETPEHL